MIRSHLSDVAKYVAVGDTVSITTGPSNMVTLTPFEADRLTDQLLARRVERERQNTGRTPTVQAPS